MVRTLLYMVVCVSGLAHSQADSVQVGQEESPSSVAIDSIVPDSSRPTPPDPREVVLEEHRVVDSNRRPAEGVRRIGHDELVRAGSLGQALAREPGVQIRQSGGLGSWTQMEVRGAPASQTEVYLDGVPLAGSAGSTVDLGPIPIDGLDWVELRQAGDAGTSGAPRLDLRSRSGWTRLGASVKQGSYGEQGISVFGGDVAGRSTVSAWMERARNDYPFVWDNGTIYNTNDDHVVKLGNNGYQGLGVAAGWRPIESIQILSRWESTRKGVTSASNPNPDAQFGKSALQTSASWESDEGPRRRVEIAGRWFSSDWKDPERSADYSVAQGMHEAGRDFRGAFDLQAVDGVWVVPQGGGDLRYETSERKSTGGMSSSPDGSRLSVAGHFGLAVGPPQGAWGGEIGSRAIWIGDDRGFADRMSVSKDTAAVATHRWSGNGRARIWVVPAAGWTSWIALEMSQRVPDFSEWMGDNGFILANPDLETERSMGSEAVLQWKRTEWMAKASLWDRRYERPIAMVSRGSGPLGIYQNGPDTRYLGLDGDLSYCKPWGWVRSTATIQDAAQSDPNPALDGNWPRWTPAVKSHLEIGATPTEFFSAGYSVDARGAVFADEFNDPSSRRPAQVVHGAWVSGSWKSVRLTFSVANLFDEPTRDWEFLPLAGRRFLAKLDWNPGQTTHVGDSSK